MQSGKLLPNLKLPTCTYNISAPHIFHYKRYALPPKIQLLQLSFQRKFVIKNKHFANLVHIKNSDAITEAVIGPSHLWPKIRMEV